MLLLANIDISEVLLLPNAVALPLSGCSTNERETMFLSTSAARNSPKQKMITRLPSTLASHGLMRQ